MTGIAIECLCITAYLFAIVAGILGIFHSLDLFLEKRGIKKALCLAYLFACVYALILAIVVPHEIGGRNKTQQSTQIEPAK